MIRPFVLLLSGILIVALPLVAEAKSKPKPEAADTADDASPAAGKAAKGKKAGAKEADAKKPDAKGGKAKPMQVGTYGDWGAFTAQAKSKTCYALAQPKERAPASLKRDAAYVFISNRPGENVRNEISIIMGFAMKDNSEAKAEIGGTTFDLICKGANAWIKNPAEESQFIETMKKGSKLVIKASSVKGNQSTDSYSLAGLSDALARVHKDCP